MKGKTLVALAVFSFFLGAFGFGYPLYSPTWGFRMDLPEDYEYSGGDRKDRFSFQNPEGAMLDLIVYHAEPGKAMPYANVEGLARDVQRRLNNSGDMDAFEYRNKDAYILELSFSIPGPGNRANPMSGWALCLELARPAPVSGGASGRAQGQNAPEPPPLLFAMAYGPEGRQDLMPIHFSALDSIAPEEADRLVPGPITEYSYPRIIPIEAPVYGLGINAVLYEEDAEAAQALIDREFQVLRHYADSPAWKEAWIRFYRAIYRDSFERLSDIAFKVERKLNVPPRENRDFADQALQWVQSFNYERDLQGSDFVNAVSAAIDGRGDCDSRAMLWAIVLKQANIPSAIMVSRSYSHAMGLADLPGPGAHFEFEKKKYLVAETTARVSIGLIGETVSDISEWIGIDFE